MPNSANQVPSLDHILVGDCMHPGILSCATDTPAGQVAGMMAKHRIHAVAVVGDGSTRPVGVISDLDIVAAAAGDADVMAVELAATEPVSISARASLRQAARVMTEHGVAHLVVLNASGGYPVGVLSTLDIAAVYAGWRLEGAGE